MRHTRLLSSLALCLAAALPAQAAVSSGTVTITGTFSFDFDAGVVTSSFSAPSDIFWEQFTSTTRAVMPVSSASVINLGVVAYASLDLAALSGLAYGLAGIDGSDVGSLLVPGDVFAVKTDMGNYAKVRVTGPFDRSMNHGLPIEWETLAPVPEPERLALWAAGLGGLALVLRRRRITR
nr:hypothetical protein [uncultured Roseateles sp.]